MARASVLRSRAPAVGLSGDLLLSGSLSKALDSPTSPSTHASHSIPRDLANGWHSTVGRAPRGGQLTKLGALFIILATPPTAAFTIWWSCFGDELGTVTGGLSKLLEDPGRVHDMFPTVTARSIFFVVAYAAFEAALCLFMPGREFRGPVTAAGNRPRYKANGMQCFCFTLGVYAWMYSRGFLKAKDVWDELPAMVTFLNALSPVLVCLLVIKGYYWPSSSDSGSSGSVIMDVYWGVELYPRILWGRLDVKTFTNCRFGMMSWAVLVITYALAQYEEVGRVSDSLMVRQTEAMVSALLQLLYVAKFFWWETGYWSSIDIMHDRAGWMICWGCLVWIPTVYTSPAMYLKARPHIVLGPACAAAVLLLGVAAVVLNYSSDAQRQAVRRARGATEIWGKPAEIIRAKYVTAQGEVKESILLVSGWWGVVRHFNYLPELAAAFLWTVPCGFSSGLPYLYFIFLVVLLSDRARRDDQRCRSKYGTYWDEYCRRVPFKMIPSIY